MHHPVLGLDAYPDSLSAPVSLQEYEEVLQNTDMYPKT
jgi:hypothetical protein